MRIPVVAAACVIILLSHSIAQAQKQDGAATRAQKPEVAAKEEALAASQKTFAEAEKGIRGAYQAMERALISARADQGSVWKAEMRRVLEALSTSAVAAAQKKAPRPQILALFKREVPGALKKIENKDLALFEAVLATRLAVVAQDVPIEAGKLEAGSLAELALEELLGAKPFHEFWNDALADLAPPAETYRKASEARDKAKWDLDIAKDPILQWQRGAPAGFARVPAGSYYVIGSSGFGSQGSRKGKKPVSLAKDVFIGLKEVTHGEFFEWWKGLDPEAKKKHIPTVPMDQGAQLPIWPTIEGAPEPEVPEEMGNKPVCGVSLATAAAYAASRGARIPTETEWCAAAGGREGRAYPWGDMWQAGQCNDADHKVNDTLPVGSMPGRGPFGHYDLAGNVAEWTATYESGKDIDPEKLENANAVVRGGSYFQAKDQVSNGWIWYRRAQFDRLKDLGFRLAMDVPKK